MSVYSKWLWPITVPTGGLDLAIAQGTNLLTDGDMEAADWSAWTAVNNPTGTRQTGTPHGGTQCGRVAYNGTNNPAYAQSCMSVSSWYYVKGWARSDGTGVPRVVTGAGGTAWQGTTSTDWQEIDEYKQCLTNGYLYLYNIASSASYCEFDDLSVMTGPGSATATVPAATYATILELCAALETQLQVADATFSVAVSAAGIVSISCDNDWDITWASTDTALRDMLGFAGTESVDGNYTLTATSKHLYGWYPGVISFGATGGASHTDESDWMPSWPRAESISGSGRKRRVLPSRPPWSRVVGWDLLTADEILDPDRGVHAMATQAVQSTVRFYPDRDIGTVAAPGTQGDPQDDPRDSETDYWMCYLDADLDWSLHGMSGAYRQLTLTIHGEPD